ncbi:MAG: alkaline [Prolixibacteraceae bacterium]|nr:MAG: alkaline [Prolixibacteraceae bacterium]
MKKTLNRIRPATAIFLFAFLIFFQAVNAQQLTGSAVSNGAATVSGGNYTGYVSAGQMATYLYSNGTQIATQGIILNQISSEVEFTFELVGTLTESQALKSGTVQIKSAVAINSGPPLAFATVNLVDAETGVIFASTQTDENGYFQFPAVPYRIFYFLVNTTEIPQNPVVLDFQSNIFVKEVVVNGEVGAGGISATVAVIPENTCSPGQPGYKVWFLDYDGDGYGNPGFWVGQCTQPVGYVLNNLDPDDNNKLIIPKSEMVCLKIKVSKGWNIFSSNGVLATPDVKYVFQRFIDRNSLSKIQDESGNSLENWGIFGGWKNNINNIAPTEGYKIKVIENDSVEICGLPVAFPYPIPLSQGWNIMGFPQTIPFNGLDVVQQLINKGTLSKVQDESGNSIEDWGIFGGWKNGIGEFTPGKGYSIKVKTEDTLWIYSSYPKSTAIKPAEIAATHFKPAYTGNGLDHVNINMVGLPLNIFKSGDELAVFDGGICVGATKVTQGNITSQTISVVASSKDNQGMPGFTEGNPFTLKYWDSAQNTEIVLYPEILAGQATFNRNESTVASLEKYAVTGVPVVANIIENEIRCYPNPFNDRVNIEINLRKDSQVQVEIMNQLGQRVNVILTKKLLNSGMNNLSWDGRNANMQQVSKGIYHVLISVDGELVNRKVVFSRQ